MIKVKDIYKLQQDVEELKISTPENNFETDWGNLPKTPMENAPITQIIFPNDYTSLEYCVIHRKSVISNYSNYLLTRLSTLDITTGHIKLFSALSVITNSEKYKDFSNAQEFIGAIYFVDILELETNSTRLINILKSKNFPEDKLLITKRSGTQSIKANVSILKGETSSLNEYKGIQGELVANIETNTIHLMDGKTFGGTEFAKKEDLNLIQQEVEDLKNSTLDTEKKKPNKIVFNGKEQMKVHYGTNDEEIIEYQLKYDGEKITKIINITENKETVIEW